MISTAEQGDLDSRSLVERVLLLSDKEEIYSFKTLAKTKKTGT